jgi:hypothetical protein
MLGSHRLGFHKKRAGTRYDELVFLHLMGFAGHMLHSAVQNINRLFFMLDWDQHGFHKKHAEIRYVELVFSIRWDLGVTAFQSMKHRRTIFHSLVGPVRIPQNACQDMLHGTYVFASGGISGSRSAFWFILGVKRRCTIFHARVGPVQIPQKVHWDALCRTCVFASGGIGGSHIAFRCAKHRCTIFRARLGLARIPQKALWDTLRQTCAFAIGGICHVVHSGA